MEDYPKSLILTPPIFLPNMRFRHKRLKAWGPFVFEQGVKKIIGMELWDEGDRIHFSDGERARFFAYERAEVVGDAVVFYNREITFKIRPIDLIDAPEFGFKKKRPGLTKEQLINMALRAFQPLK